MLLTESRVSNDRESTKFFSHIDLSTLDFNRIPKHIAIIPDGNRRWAKKRAASPEIGHREGADILMDIVKSSKELGVKTVTVYGFSTENWSRSPIEVQAIMFVITSYLNQQRNEMVKHDVRLKAIGDLTGLPTGLINALNETRNATAHCKSIDLVLALNYGGRDELRRAFNALLEDYDSKKLSKESITEEMIARYLDTTGTGDPELMIRTSGEMRLSNFMIWQSSYTEVYVTDVLWPDFTPKHLLEAILNYQQRNRRLGGT